MLGLCCCAWTLWRAGDYSLIAGHRFLIVVASLCGGAWALGHIGSVVVKHGLSCSVACGMFLGQELKGFSAMAVRFSTTGPPGSPKLSFLILK